VAVITGHFFWGGERGILAWGIMPAVTAQNSAGCPDAETHLNIAPLHFRTLVVLLKNCISYRNFLCSIYWVGLSVAVKLNDVDVVVEGLRAQANASMLASQIQNLRNPGMLYTCNWF